LLKTLLIRLCCCVGALVIALLWWRPAAAYPVPCQGAAAQADIDEALARIRSRLDPCGESPLVAALLDKVERCAATSYRICTDLNSDRNWFDRPIGDAALVRTITWNPGLATPVEYGCEGDPNKAVLRDATASLLHELAHAAQDCDGLDPTANEFDAVRIENVYRRAAGLCQRTVYGKDPLPPAMLRTCTTSSCPCTPPTTAVQLRAANSGGGSGSASGSGPAAASADAAPGGAAR